MQEVKFPGAERFAEIFEGDDVPEQMNNRVRQLRGEHGHPTVVKRRKIGRNDPCLCGSGTKFKNCCLRRTEPA